MDYKLKRKIAWVCAILGIGLASFSNNNSLTGMFAAVFLMLVAVLLIRTNRKT